MVLEIKVKQKTIFYASLEVKLCISVDVNIFIDREIILKVQVWAPLFVINFISVVVTGVV